jgi:hypothetical protein
MIIPFSFSSRAVDVLPCCFFVVFWNSKKRKRKEEKKAQKRREREGIQWETKRHEM